LLRACKSFVMVWALGLSAPRRPESALAVWKYLPEIEPPSDLMASVATLRSARPNDAYGHDSRFRMT
jgi:hypothetical protein